MAELLLPNARDWIDSFQAGQQAGMTQRRNTALVGAGGMMANGDYKGAAAQLYGAGDIQGGSAIAQAGYTQAQESQRVQRQQAVQAHIQANDLPGAYQAAGADPDLLAALDKVTAHAKDTTAQTAAALQALKDPATGQWLPPDQARAKYAQIKPALIARGLPASQLDAFDPTPENLQAMQSQVLGLSQQLEMTKGVAVGSDLVNPYSGKEMHKGDQFKTVGPGQTLVKVGGDPGSPSAAAAGAAGAPQTTQAEAPIPTGGVYDQVGQIAAAKGAKPAEVAYLQRLAQVESTGQPAAQNGRSTGLFQFHPDTFAQLGGKDITDVGQQTQAALALQARDRANLQQIGVEPTDANTYIMHQQGAGGGRALLTSPPGMNAVAALTPVYGSADIARKAIVSNGGTPNMTAGDFVNMWRARWANGGAPVAGGLAAPARTAPATAPSADGVQVVYQGGPEWKPDGHGALVNTATGDRKLDPTDPMGAAGVTGAGAGLHGADFLSAIPPTQAQQVKALAEGRMPFPAGFALKSPYWQQMIAAVSQYDPTFDAVNYNARAKTRQDFTSGKNAQNIKALNTAIGHLGRLDSQIGGTAGLGGFPGATMVNSGINAYERSSGDPGVTNFEQTASALATELTSVFRGTGGAEADVNRYLSQLTSNASAAQKKAAVQNIAQLLNSRLEAIGSQYEQGMGTTKDPLELLNPDAAATFRRLSGQPAAPAPAAAAGPARLSPQDAARLPPGTHFIGLDGVERVRH